MTLLAVVAASALTISSMDAAFANNGKGKGSSASGGNAGESSASGRSGNGAGNSNNASSRSNSSANKTGNANSAANLSRSSKGTLHPANLGELNGAINSSASAKLAHIRNGNFNGPVGLAAALALADYNYSLVDVAALNSAKDTLALAAAFDLIANPPTESEIAAAEAGELDPLVAEAILSYPQRLAAAEALVADQDTPPTSEEIAAAQSVVDQSEQLLADVDAAESNVLDAYKGSLDAQNRDEVLQAVRDGNFPSSEQIATTQS